mgnify:CR=1 FL=1
MPMLKPKVLMINCKVSDGFRALLLDEAGNTMADYIGYVPDFMPGEHYGDYVELEIDIETGKILNWKRPSSQDLSKFIQDARSND